MKENKLGRIIKNSIALLILSIVIVSLTSMGMNTFTQFRLNIIRAYSEEVKLKQMLNEQQLTMLSERDFFEHSDEVLKFVQKKQPSVEVVQSVEIKNSYVNIDTLTANQEVITYGFSYDEIVHSVPELNEKDDKNQKEFDKNNTTYEKKLTKLEKQEKDMEQKKLFWKKFNILGKINNLFIPKGGE